jgi:hypothetical protein
MMKRNNTRRPTSTVNLFSWQMPETRFWRVAMISVLSCALAALAVGCSGDISTPSGSTDDPSKGTSSGQPQPPASAAPTGSLTEQAEQFAWSEFKSRWLQQDGFWFTCYIHVAQPSKGPYDQGTPESRLLKQLKGLQWRTKMDALSEADRLAGIRWKGTIEYAATSLRRHESGKGWSQWEDATGAIIYDQAVQLRNGKWEDTRNISYPGQPVIVAKPNPADIPK